MRLFTRCINLLVIALLITPSQALATSKAVRNIRNLDIIDSGVDGYILKTNGTTIEWQPQPDTKITGLIDNGDNVAITGNGTLADPYIIEGVGGTGGTVTSVGIIGVNGINISDSPITTNGDITVTLDQGSVLVPSDIGTKVQIYSPNLDTLATNNGNNLTITALSNHISNNNIHFTQEDISITESQISDFGDYQPSNSNLTTLATNDGSNLTNVTPSNITNLIDSGNNINLTGTGTIADPYIIEAVGGNDGTVTSVGIIGVNGITISGSPVTTSGDITVTLNQGSVLIPSDVGTLVQAYSSNLNTLATNNGNNLTITALSNHISNGSIHFTQASISITESQISDFGDYQPLSTNLTLLTVNNGVNLINVTPSNITGLIDNGDNVTLTGNGTLANPYVISSSGSGAGGDALTTDSLSQFAATTSAELAGVITDEVGSGSLVFNISPTINGASFLNTVTVNGTFLAKAHALHPNAINSQTGNTYTLNEEDNGKIVTLNNSSDIVVTVPDTLPSNFGCTLIQIGNGQVSVEAAGSLNLITSLGPEFNKLSSIWSIAAVYRVGSSDDLILSGDISDSESGEYEGFGTVTSIDISASNGLVASGGPITTNGVIALTLDQSTISHSVLANLSSDDHTQYHTDARANTWLSTKSTTNLAEGTNLYFTNARADNRIANAVGTTIQAYSPNLDTLATNNGNNLTITALSDHISNGNIHFRQSDISITESQISDLGSYQPSSSNLDTLATNNGISLINVTPSNITGLIDNGSNITIAGAGTATDPYVITSTTNNGGSEGLKNITINNGDTFINVVNGELATNGTTTISFIDPGFITGNETITLSGDVTGSGTTSITTTVVNDSHNHTASTINLASTDLSDTVGLARLAAEQTFTGVNTFSNGVNLSGEIASTIAHFDSSKDIKSLPTSIYPSLTELSYVKGVTSSIQTQLSSKGSGTVTSIGIIGVNGLSISGSPVTTTGDITITLNQGSVLVPSNVGVSVQSYNSNLDTLALNNGNNLIITALSDHISNGNIHFTQEDISITESQISDFGNYQPLSSNLTLLATNNGVNLTNVTPSNITGLIDNGDNVTLIGTGTLADPYVISSTASGGGGLSNVTINNGDSFISVVNGALATNGTTIISFVNPGFLDSSDIGTTVQSYSNNLDVLALNNGNNLNITALSNHIDNGNIHFKQSDISITESQISDLGSYQPLSSNLTILATNNGSNLVLSNLTQITNRSHTSLSDIGTNTHSQIDGHIADSSIHFTQASISITESQISDFGDYQPLNANLTLLATNNGSNLVNVGFKNVTIDNGDTFINVINGELVSNQTTIISFNDPGFITGNETITLSGDVTGSGTTSITTTVVNDSHSHTASTITLASTDLSDSSLVARLNSSNEGNLGLGTSAPSVRLEVNGTTISTAYALRSDSVNQQTGTTYTLQPEDNGRVVTLNNLSGIIVTIPDTLPANFGCTLIQTGNGQVSVVAGGSLNLRTSLGPDYNKMHSIWSSASVYRVGSSNDLIFSGDIDK